MGKHDPLTALERDRATRQFESTISAALAAAGVGPGWDYEYDDDQVIVVVVASPHGDEWTLTDESDDTMPDYWCASQADIERVSEGPLAAVLKDLAARATARHDGRE